MQRLAAMERLMLASPDQQISLTDPDSRSMATSGRGSGVVGYNVQVAVDTKHHLIVAHEVTNDGSDRAQLANIACQAKAILGVDELQAVADRGYFSSEEILACDQAGITVTLPKPITSGIEAKGRFGKQDFVYLSDEDVYRCPAGEKLAYHFTNEENGLVLRRYWTNASLTQILLGFRRPAGLLLATARAAPSTSSSWVSPVVSSRTAMMVALGDWPPLSGPGGIAMSAVGSDQNRTYAPQRASLENLVSTAGQWQRNCNAERAGGLHVDVQLDLGYLLDR
jgi:hypothetical protein